MSLASIPGTVVGGTRTIDRSQLRSFVREKAKEVKLLVVEGKREEANQLAKYLEFLSEMAVLPTGCIKRIPRSNTNACITDGKLQGGWGRAQHAGYRMGITRRMPASDPRLYDVKKGKGTYTWAQRAGLGERQACMLGHASDGVDHGKTNTITLCWLKSASQYHFNMGKGADASTADSRVILAVEHFREAIDLWGEGKQEEAIRKLGRGVHPLQDIFAHATGFVKYLNLGCVKIPNHIMKMSADDPAYEEDVISPRCLIEIRPEDPIDSYEVNMSQRYSDTKTATLLYVGLFLVATGQKQASALNYLDARIKTKNLIGFLLLFGLSYAKDPGEMQDLLNKLLKTSNSQQVEMSAKKQTPDMDIEVSNFDDLVDRLEKYFKASFESATVAHDALVYLKAHRGDFEKARRETLEEVHIADIEKVPGLPS